MNLTVAEGVALVAKVAGGISGTNVDVAVFPSFVALEAVGKSLTETSVALGAQDVYWKQFGAFTGEVSAKMLVDAGCSYCIVGHSERRGRFGVSDDTPASYFSDTDVTVNLKASALISAGITPIVCVGETLREKEDGNAPSIIGEQLEGSLQGIDLNECIVAYEPVWAIGTGKVCEPDEAAERCDLIRDFCGRSTLKVLYGGSVKSTNARDLFARSELDGALVGGASLDPDEFLRIIELA